MLARDRLYSEEIRELLRVEPLPGAEIVKTGLTGGWADHGLTGTLMDGLALSDASLSLTICLHRGGGNPDSLGTAGKGLPQATGSGPVRAWRCRVLTRGCR